jgi:hypothetical protein
VQRSFTISGGVIGRATRARPANQRRRFAQKTGFGERRCDVKAARAKIFLLPKIATQSPRRMLASAAEARQQYPRRAIRHLREVRKRLRRRRFCNIGNLPHRIFARFVQQSANALSCRRAARATRRALRASILP